MQNSIITVALLASTAAAADPKLTPGLQPLEPMLGAWEVTETFHAGGFTPKEMTAKGSDDIRIGPGGNAIIADYQSAGELGPYTAHDMITWDAQAKRFHFLFIDSFGANVQLHTGKVVGSTFVFEGPFTFGTTPGTLRRTYKDITATSSTLVAEFVAGTKVTKLVTIKKTRRK